MYGTFAEARVSHFSDAAPSDPSLCIVRVMNLAVVALIWAGANDYLAKRVSVRELLAAAFGKCVGETKGKSLVIAARARRVRRLPAHAVGSPPQALALY